MNLPLLLRAFHAIATAGSVTAAARNLGLSQPTLSAQLAELERHYGVELFHRRGRRLSITPLGEALRDRTHRMLELEDDAASLLGQSGALLVGELKVAAVGPYNLMPLLGGFMARHPQVRVQVATGDGDTVIRRISALEADVGLLVRAPDDPRIDALPLRRQQLWLIAPADHRLARRHGVRLSDVAGERFVMRDPGSTTRQVFEACLRAQGLAVRTALTVSSREAVRHAVVAGLGLGVVSDAGYVPGEAIRGIPFEDADMATHAHLAWLTGRGNAGMVRAFVACARSVLGERALRSP